MATRHSRHLLLNRAGDEEPATCGPSAACGKEPLAQAAPRAKSPRLWLQSPWESTEWWVGLGSGRRGPPMGWACACGLETWALDVGVTSCRGEGPGATEGV